VVKKADLAQKIFQANGHMQGGKKVPLPAKKEYGTGLPVKASKKRK
jgi:hypothetical protein